MTSATVRRSGAILVAAVLLASLAVVTTAAPASAKPTCRGKPATIVGTSKGEVIKGTPKADVIVARGGNDVVYGRGGDDIICGNRGNDRLVGGAGDDRLRGQYGRDRLVGGGGEDWLLGGPGADRLLGGMGHDLLDGGYGSDVCRPGPASGPHRHCEDVPSVTPRNLAIAFSDLDGNHRYGPGDVLISRLFDTNGDGIASKGDTIHMGKYPVDTEMTAFVDWGVKTHTVQEGGPTGFGYLMAHTVGNGYHSWGGDGYAESIVGSTGSTYTSIHDGYDGDWLRLEPTSPSHPAAKDWQSGSGEHRDRRFIDVVVYP